MERTHFLHNFLFIFDLKTKEVKSALRLKLESWLNKNMKILMSDGRTLVGIFLCTDRDRNVILGSCVEYLKPNGISNELFVSH